MAKYSTDGFPDIPPEYVADRFREWIVYATGSAVIRAQYVERVLNAICFMLGTKGLKFNQEDFLSGDATRLKQTLGLIKAQLRESKVFDDKFIDRLQEFTRRRNRLIHGLYADTFQDDNDFEIESRVAQEYVEQCEWLIRESPELVEIGFGIFRVFLEGVSPDHADYDALMALRREFDEYFERGLDTIALDLRANFKQSE
jgi:hypothetical protein